MGYVLVTPPSVEPVSLEEVKQHCREESTDSDTYIEALILGARQYAETRTGRSLVEQEWKATSVSFPCAGGYLRLLHGPVISVDEVKYIDENGDEQTLDASGYVVDLARDVPRIYLAPDESWPSITAQPGAVSVTYTAGYGDEPQDVPAPILAAIQQIAAQWFDNRSAISENSMSVVPNGADMILDLYRIPTLA